MRTTRPLAIALVLFSLTLFAQGTPPAQAPPEPPDPAQQPAPVTPAGSPPARKAASGKPAAAPTKKTASEKIEPPPLAGPNEKGQVLNDHLLITWYGNPNSNRMGILGERKGADLANGLKQQAAEYAKHTTKQVMIAYHLVAVVAQGAPGTDEKYRRRESPKIMQALLDEARANGFKLIVDVQTGHSTVADEVNWLKPFLMQPDVYLALDPEFAMINGVVPGKKIGTMYAKDINDGIDIVEKIIKDNHLPPKVVIVHQFTWNMLPDKLKVRPSSMVDVVLDMDGFGDRTLKLSTYRAVIRQVPMPQTGFEFMGVKLFYKQDKNLFAPAHIMALKPTPAVVIYQ